MPYVEEVSVERSLPNKVIITVTESQALAYIALGDEMWSIDHSCKVLGKATEEELADMISIEGISPGTLFIGETMLTEDNDTELVEYLAQVLYQLEARDLYKQVESIDFSDKYDVVFALGDKYTVKLGGPGDTEYKFGMLVSVMSQLLEGDIGIIDVSDGSTAHFRPM